MALAGQPGLTDRWRLSRFQMFPHEVPMFRRSMVVLLTLPMLMPPGICVCQLQAAFVTASSPSENTEEPVACCRKCGRTKCDHQKTTNPGQTPDRSDDSNPSPQSPDHAPGCPANPCYSIRMTPTVEAKVSVGEAQFSYVMLDSYKPFLVVITSSQARTIDAPPPSSPADIFLLVCNIRC